MNYLEDCCTPSHLHEEIATCIRLMREAHSDPELVLLIHPEVFDCMVAYFTYTSANSGPNVSYMGIPIQLTGEVKEFKVELVTYPKEEDEVPF